MSELLKDNWSRIVAVSSDEYEKLLSQLSDKFETRKRKSLLVVPMVPPRDKHGISDSEAVQKAWEADYIGDRHVTEFLNEIHLIGEKDAYCNILALVNSSGTGKSKLVYEMAKEVLSVPICLRVRETGDVTESEWPPGDYDVRRSWPSSSPLYLRNFMASSKTHRTGCAPETCPPKSWLRGFESISYRKIRRKSPTAIAYTD